MAKVIPAKEFKKAIQELNDLLKTKGEESIKFVGVKKEVAVTNFTNKILDFIEKDIAVELPASVIAFYNKHIVDDEPEATPTEEVPVEEVPVEEETPKESTPTKAEKAKKVEKAKKPEKEPKAPGVVALAVQAYLNGTTVTKDIEKEIQDQFPDRNIYSTVATVVCILNHVPNLKK